MVDRPNKPSALAATPGATPQAQVVFSDDNSRVTATLPTGESVEVLLHGATVVSWKGRGGDERLWLSEAAKLDGSKAVRGGIPLVFPVFGTAPDHAATSQLPQHGFARTSRWEFLGKSTSESTPGNADGQPADLSVKLDFGLSSGGLTAESRALWEYGFNLIYSVTLDPRSLTTTIIITNEDKRPFEFQTLMHTYLKINDITTTTVHGLDSSPYTDKLDPTPEPKTQSGPVTFTGETDRIYTPAGGPSSPVEVRDASGRTVYSVVRDNIADVVVWNPWTAKAESIADFAPKDGWHHMVCVEPGAVATWQTLEPGDAFEAAQTIVV